MLYDLRLNKVSGSTPESLVGLYINLAIFFTRKPDPWEQTINKFEIIDIFHVYFI